MQQDTNNSTQLYDVVMFNHSLHHYSDFTAQLNGLSQAIFFEDSDVGLFRAAKSKIDIDGKDQSGIVQQSFFNNRLFVQENTTRNNSNIDIKR